MYRDQDRDRDRDWSSRSKRRRRDHEYWVFGRILSRVSSAMASNAPYLLKLFLREKHAVQAIIGMLKSSVKAWIFGAAKLIGRLIINPDNEPFILPFGPQKCDLRESSLAKVESKKECFKFPLPSPDYEIKETKNIYVDSNESLNGTEGTNSVKVVNGVVQGRTRTLVERFERRERLNSDEVQAPHTTPQIRPKTAKISPMLNGHPQITERELTSANDGNVAEDLMRNHDVFLSTLRSRLTKLQVVRHFWERNNIKGAIDATRKLPDHSVQADLISILMEKMEILTLDLFSCLLPVLLGLLDSKMERHASISLEMLLKLVAVFGPVVHSTISAPPAVGVDLHAEQRLECCNQCFIQLQKIHKYLPMLVRRGGLLAKCAQELNVVLQNS